MRVTETPPRACPVCQKTLDRLSGAGHDRRPAPGDDITICLYCTAVLSIEAGLDLRLLSAEEVAALPPPVLETIDRVRRLIPEAKRQAGVRPC